jgi:Glycosyl hydrolases family 16
MKYALAVLALAVGVCSVPAAGATAATPPPVPVKSLIVDAEFNGPAGAQPSHRLWGAKGYGKWSGWSHIAENGAGSLILTAYKDPAGSWHTPWLSGRIGYSGPRYVEARAEVPCGAGTWSAPIWEWAYPYGRIPGFENDVAEQLGYEPTQYHATLHYWTQHGRDLESGEEVTAASPLCGTFHTYGAAVFKEHVAFYLDGTLATSIPASAVGLSNLTSRKEVVNVDLAMGGLGRTITVGSPVVLEVDFIHVYGM